MECTGMGIHRVGDGMKEGHVIQRRQCGNGGRTSGRRRRRKRIDIIIIVKQGRKTRNISFRIIEGIEGREIRIDGAISSEGIVHTALSSEKIDEIDNGCKGRIRWGTQSGNGR